MTNNEWWIVLIAGFFVIAFYNSFIADALEDRRVKKLEDTKYKNVVLPDYIKPVSKEYEFFNNNLVNQQGE
ncbi:hypothetical protein [Burkholderia multivorans]|uniref:hypothetical protein n=1 Tax=Burkholderia multivorans TaxID=87883 RepID=UPI001C2758B9|nr:hypothetical protein [Burkholderia multivorans]MBU9542851.1 hypothetical protein [Burkholderia multivorans]